jgi:hypothetical protein
LLAELWYPETTLKKDFSSAALPTQSRSATWVIQNGNSNLRRRELSIVISREMPVLLESQSML